MPNPVLGTILGAYRIEGSIGSGSMGEVFRGIDTGLNRRVAIKILSEKHRDSPELRARFVREGRAVAAISHPNVVQVFATGSYDERPYIAMELLDGTDLGSAVEKKGPLSSTEAAHAIFDAAQGLAAASRAGLIHRDVKPSNLVRLSDGKVKVTDFGLAKPLDPGTEPALTAMGVVVGTPDYIAPEQARGEPIDERVDIYALGGTLYFLLTGMPPFRTGRPADDKYLKVVARHLRNPPPDAAQTKAGVDRELSELAKQMMAKKADDRPTYSELIQRSSGILARLDPGSVPELMAATRERSRPNIVIGAPASSGAALSRRGTVTEGELAPARGGFPAWMIVVTLACVGLFVAGLTVYLTRGEDTSTSTSTSTSVPQGMLLVSKPDGHAWFYVDERPVNAGEYRQVFADHQQPGADSDPVVMIGYDEARSFAHTRGGRLLRGDEWGSAAATPGFLAPGGDTYEWIESVEGKREVRQRGKAQPRSDKGGKDVTFRVVKDI